MSKLLKRIISPTQKPSVDGQIILSSEVFQVHSVSNIVGRQLEPTCKIAILNILKP